MDKSQDDHQNEYHQPSLKKYGDIERLTAGNATGAFTDRSFPDNTPRGDLTFSGSR